MRTRLREMTVIYGLIFGMFVILQAISAGTADGLDLDSILGRHRFAGRARVLPVEPTPHFSRQARLPGAGDGDRACKFRHLLSDQPVHRAFVGKRFGQGTVDHEEFCAPDIDLDTHLWDLRPQELAPGRACISGSRPDSARLDTGFCISGIRTICNGCSRRRDDGVIPMRLFGVDAVFLLTLAAISAFGAHTISRLRQQVVEARQLGQYRLGRRIGSGGMGDVYLAEHQLLKRPCAVKLIRPGELLKAGTIKRFEREVRINATLSHPNIVEIFDYGRTEDGVYYYVMEYLPGLSLAELVARHGPLPPERAVYLLRQVCLALHEAHEAGVIHRDIKPSNIFAARRGGRDDVAKLLDFGLVQPASTNLSADPSRVGQIVGTPLYISPEQALGERKLDARSDIYSLGAVAYFLLTGRPPFDEGSAIAAIIAHARDQAPPPSRFRDGLPEDLERIVMRCLAKAPAERYPDAESLELALAECACAGKWDKYQANRWWRERGQVGEGSLTKKHSSLAPPSRCRSRSARRGRPVARWTSARPVRGCGG